MHLNFGYAVRPDAVGQIDIKAVFQGVTKRDVGFSSVVAGTLVSVDLVGNL